MTELQLMDWQSNKHSVCIKENAKVRIRVVSGNHILVKPKYYDPSDSRIVDFYDGEIEFKATKENVEKYNAMQDTYDYEDISFN